MHENLRKIARETVKNLETNHLGIGLKDFMRKYLSVEAFGEIPDYSGRHSKGYHICPVTTVTASAFVVLAAYDQEISDWVFVFVKNSSKSDCIACVGGFLNLDPEDEVSSNGEQPQEGLIRELQEELLDNESNPILADITPKRFSLLWSGIDYRGCDVDLQGTHNTGYFLLLEKDELRRLKLHSHRALEDTTYADQIENITGGEVREIILLSLNDLKKENITVFKHPHELEALWVCVENIS